MNRDHTRVHTCATLVCWGLSFAVVECSDTHHHVHQKGMSGDECLAPEVSGSITPAGPPNGAQWCCVNALLARGPAGFLEGDGNGIVLGLCVCVGAWSSFGESGVLVGMCLCWVCVVVVGWRGDVTA
jgi:hypothetical protein